MNVFNVYKANWISYMNVFNVYMNVFNVYKANWISYMNVFNVYKATHALSAAAQLTYWVGSTLLLTSKIVWC